jgi:DNA polymerase III psi subunit
MKENKYQHVRLLTNAEIESLERAIKEIDDVIRAAKMENTNFFPLDPESQKKMDEIKHVSSGWRESWIIDPLETNKSNLQSILKTLKRVKVQSSTIE